MSTNKGILVYNEKPINFREEMLCLTDMWKAAGKPASSSPAEWQRSADAEKFIEFISETQNMGISHVIKSNPGKGGGTWAYWQIAFAYAKKLSPEFHAWVNQAAREKMEVLAGKQSEKPKRIRRPRIDTAFIGYYRIASLAPNMDQNQCWLAAGRATYEKCGENPCETLGITSLAAPDQTNHKTVTEIGKMIGLSAQAVNKALLAMRYQVKVENHSSTSSPYEMLENGKPYGRMYDETRKHGRGSQQVLKWSPDVAEKIKQHLETMDTSSLTPLLLAELAQKATPRPFAHRSGATPT